MVYLFQHKPTSLTKGPSVTFDDSFTQKWLKPLILIDISFELIKAQIFQFCIFSLLSLFLTILLAIGDYRYQSWLDDWDSKWFYLLISKNTLPNDQSMNNNYVYHYEQDFDKIVFSKKFGLGSHNMRNMSEKAKKLKKPLFFTFSSKNRRYSIFIQFSKISDLIS